MKLEFITSCMFLKIFWPIVAALTHFLYNYAITPLI